jgi:D-beta-D-heptose 7-phosphate kinase/D-beta-D-heptose 1-phosphate adenosyltransferase
MNRTRIQELLQRFTNVPVTVIGDLILDQFIWGRVERISPEAPVPVIEITRETIHLGGAANVAANLVALGARPVLIGVIGQDQAGLTLRNELERMGMDTGGVVIDQARATTVKTRIIAHHQQVCRADRECRDAVVGAVLDQLLAAASRAIQKTVGTVISDYAKGVLMSGFLGTVIGESRSKNKFVAVDPKVDDFTVYRGASVITPNKKEAERAAGISITSEESLIAAGRRLLERTGAEHILITRGEEGMTLVEPQRYLHLPTAAREVFDVTGAGDTVIATLSAALGAGADVQEAAYLANHAAGVVVGRVGTASATREDILASLEDESG